MATLSDPRKTTQTVVAYDEPPVKPPPILSVGPLAWVRQNLFRTTLDTILTFVSSVILITVVVGLFQWAVSAANWFVITRNIRLLMVGTFPPENVWRIEWAALLCAFAVGFTLYAYTRLRRGAVGIFITLLAVIVITPPIVYLTTAPVEAYLAAGNLDVQSGTVTEAPQDVLGFVARAGETVTVRLASEGASDDLLATAAGFTDRAAQGLVNAAANRLAMQERIAMLRDRLAHDVLTDAQRAALTEELNSLQVPPPVTETYMLNQLPVKVTILNGATMEPLAEADLASTEDVLTVTLPNDGWYVLQKTIREEDGEGVAVLAVTGVYPILERNLTSGQRRIIQYSRVVDDFETDAVRPQIDGRNVPANFLGDNQYQGERPLTDYLRISVAPFFDLIARAFVPMTVFGVAGYGLAWGIGRVLPSRMGRAYERKLSVRAAVPVVWTLFLIALFILAYGINQLNSTDAGLLLGKFAWVGWMFFIGAALNKPWGRPLLALAVLIGIVQAGMSEGLTLARLTNFDNFPTGAVLGVIIWLGIGLLAARQGVGARKRLGERVTPAAALAGLIWLAALLLPIVLINTAVGAGMLDASIARNLLPQTDTRRWGGLLLTMVLTVVAILASFPLGVLLALGRRSKSLPAVRWVCTVYIELVRGVPLITVLFMAQLLVPLVDVRLANVDAVFRAMVGLTLFSGAYLAENVRGGLQSIPPGQEEAAKALGLNGVQITLLITLPQALRAVIPALVGQSIALFKDTSLVALVGLTDLTGIAKSIIAQAEFVGLQSEIYFFISIIYFVFSYIMAYISRRIEASGSGSARRI